MAVELDRQFADRLRQTEGTVGEFNPGPHYNPRIDSLVLYLRDESSYEKPITKYLTIFLSNANDSLVAIEIRRASVIAKAIEDLGEVRIAHPISVKGEDGQTFDLDVIVDVALALRGSRIAQPEREAIEKATRGVHIDKRMLCGA